MYTDQFNLLLIGWCSYDRTFMSSFYTHSAVFFCLLFCRFQDACDICCRQLQDLQLALFLCRLIDACSHHPSGPSLVVPESSSAPVSSSLALSTVDSHQQRSSRASGDPTTSTLHVPSAASLPSSSSCPSLCAVSKDPERQGLETSTSSLTVPGHIQEPPPPVAFPVPSPSPSIALSTGGATSPSDLPSNVSSAGFSASSFPSSLRDSSTSSTSTPSTLPPLMECRRLLLDRVIPSALAAKDVWLLHLAHWLLGDYQAAFLALVPPHFLFPSAGKTSPSSPLGGGPELSQGSLPSSSSFPFLDPTLFFINKGETLNPILQVSGTATWSSSHAQRCSSFLPNVRVSPDGGIASLEKHSSITITRAGGGLTRNKPKSPKDVDDDEEDDDHADSTALYDGGCLRHSRLSLSLFTYRSFVLSTVPVRRLAAQLEELRTEAQLKERIKETMMMKSNERGRMAISATGPFPGGVGPRLCVSPESRESEEASLSPPLPAVSQQGFLGSEGDGGEGEQQPSSSFPPDGIVSIAEASRDSVAAASSSSSCSSSSSASTSLQGRMTPSLKTYVEDLCLGALTHSDVVNASEFYLLALAYLHKREPFLAATAAVSFMAVSRGSGLFFDDYGDSMSHTANDKHRGEETRHQVLTEGVVPTTERKAHQQWKRGGGADGAQGEQQYLHKDGRTQGRNVSNAGLKGESLMVSPSSSPPASMSCLSHSSGTGDGLTHFPTFFDRCLPTVLSIFEFLFASWAGPLAATVLSPSPSASTPLNVNRASQKAVHISVPDICRLLSVSQQSSNANGRRVSSSFSASQSKCSRRRASSLSVLTHVNPGLLMILPESPLNRPSMLHFCCAKNSTSNCWGARPLLQECKDGQDGIWGSHNTSPSPSFSLEMIRSPLKSPLYSEKETGDCVVSGGLPPWVEPQVSLSLPLSLTSSCATYLGRIWGGETSLFTSLLSASLLSASSLSAASTRKSCSTSFPCSPVCPVCRGPSSPGDSACPVTNLNPHTRSPSPSRCATVASIPLSAQEKETEEGEGEIGGGRETPWGWARNDRRWR